MSIRITKISSKGQVVIPKELRDQEGLLIGDSVMLTTDHAEVHVVKRTGWAQATAGCLPSSVSPLEPAELDRLMDEAATQEIREKYGDVNR